MVCVNHIHCYLVKSLAQSLLGYKSQVGTLARLWLRSQVTRRIHTKLRVAASGGKVCVRARADFIRTSVLFGVFFSLTKDTFKIYYKKYLTHEEGN